MEPVSFAILLVELGTMTAPKGPSDSLHLEFLYDILASNDYLPQYSHDIRVCSPMNSHHIPITSSYSDHNSPIIIVAKFEGNAVKRFEV